LRLDRVELPCFEDYSIDIEVFGKNLAQRFFPLEGKKAIGLTADLPLG